MKATILIVEDEDFLQAMLQLAFERRGFAVFVAGNVADGLVLAAAHSLDAVLTDFQLPGANGLQLCRTLRKQNESLAQHLPIWVMTGSHELSDQEAAEAGALEVFRKPFKAIDLCRKIERFIRSEAEDSRAERIGGRPPEIPAIKNPCMSGVRIT